jgi:hypothetical protein
VYSRCEGYDPRNELTPHAQKVCRVLLGARPDDPEYERLWRLRLISAPDAKPPVPLEPEASEKKPTKKRAKKQKR